MKKIITILIILLFPCIISAQSERITFGDLLDDLEDAKQQKLDQENKKTLSEEEYNKVAEQISVTDSKIQELDRKIQETKKKIEDLNTKIEEKKEETNKILIFLQVSNGEKSYLEYIFKATSFTDFIHRVSIVEELSKYNKELINDMNNLITESNKYQEELKKDKQSEETERTNLRNQYKQLGSKITELNKLGLSIDEEIKELEEMIASYRSKGCSNRSDKLTICGRTEGIPYDTGFIRPVPGDVITSRYGIRKSPITGAIEGHTGIDISVYGSKEGEPIYAAADGKVAYKYKVSCGGQMIVLHHNIKGEAYTTIYMHLLSYGNFDIGDTVTKYDVIAYMGGGPTTATRYGNKGSYDYCTTGTHLHFTIAKGHIGLSGYRNYIVDPENYVYFPYKFEGRTW